ncbi:MAG: UDP-3-O-(3-hydroxymyristoyl)glucosamine N-acyltransferase [Haloarculaceae archaeon]
MRTHAIDRRAHGRTRFAGRLGEADRLSAAALASFLDAERLGPNETVRGLNSLADAGPDDLAFSVHEDPAPVRESDAGVVVGSPALGPLPDRAVVYVARPKVAFARVAHEFFLEPLDETRIHPSAVVDGAATVGERTRIGPQATLAAPVTVGDGCYVGANTAVGGVGFGFVETDAGRHLRQVHAGEVVIEDEVAVGANCSIDRAVFDRTVVRRGAKLSGNVHLAHQVEIGEDATVAYGCGFAGGASVGAGATIHPHASVATDVTVGAGAEVGMHATVLDDVPPETTVVGSPARPIDRS